MVVQSITRPQETLNRLLKCVPQLCPPMRSRRATCVRITRVPDVPVRLELPGAKAAGLKNNAPCKGAMNVPTSLLWPLRLGDFVVKTLR